MKLIRSHIVTLCFYYFIAWWLIYLFTTSWFDPTFGGTIVDAWFVRGVSGAMSGAFLLLFFLDLVSGSVYTEDRYAKEGSFDIVEYENLTLVAFRNTAWTYRERKADIAELDGVLLRLTYDYTKDKCTSIVPIPYEQLKDLEKEKVDDDKGDKTAS